MATQINLTTLVTNKLSDWFSISTEYNQPRKFLVLQGYWTGVTAVTPAGSINVDLTMNKSAADIYGMYDSTDAIDIDSASGAFTFNIENRGFKFLRLNIDLTAIDSIPILTAFTNTEIT